MSTTTEARPRRRLTTLSAPGGGERTALWEQMKPEAHRVAVCMWHCGYSRDDAWRELRTFTAYAAERGKFRVKCGELANDTLDEALADLEASYARTTEKMMAAALSALQRKETRIVVELQAAAVAAAAEHEPPTRLILHAIDQALRLHGWRERQWQRVGVAA
jgi:hypothetical protein